MLANRESINIDIEYIDFTFCFPPARAGHMRRKINAATGMPSKHLNKLSGKSRRTESLKPTISFWLFLAKSGTCQ